MMRRRLDTERAALVAAVAVLSLCDPAFAGSTIVLPQLGIGSLDPDLRGISDPGDSAVFVLAAGHRFDSNLIVAGSYGKADNFGWVTFGAQDSYELDEYSVLLGYSIEITARFRVVPVVGLKHWRFQGREGFLLNPGQAGRVDMTGSDVYGTLNLEFPLGEKIGLNLAYEYGDYDFGEMTSTRLGVKFEF